LPTSIETDVVCGAATHLFGAGRFHGHVSYHITKTHPLTRASVQAAELMDRDSTSEAGMPPSLRVRAGSYRSGFAAPSLAASFRLDEGYSDETRSQPDNEGSLILTDAMPLPDWLLTHSEADRSGTWERDVQD
jgi:hypothetical protein